MNIRSNNPFHGETERKLEADKKNFRAVSLNKKAYADDVLNHL